MSTWKHAGGVFASAAVIAVSAFILVGSLEAFAARQIGEVSLFLATQATLAAALFMPAVFSRMGDRETLSVYREMSNRR
jgi:hypothetical protein